MKREWAIRIETREINDFLNKHKIWIVTDKLQWEDRSEFKKYYMEWNGNYTSEPRYPIISFEELKQIIEGPLILEPLIFN